MKRWLPNMRWFSLLGFMALLLSGCGKPYISALRPGGEVADMQYDLMILATLIMVVVIAVVTVIFIYVVLRFRRKKGESKIPKQVEGNHKLEIIWTVIPILLLLILAVPTVSATFKLADVKAMDDKNKDTVVINVTSNLYWWEFEYPDQKIVTAQELVVPTDEKVYFKLKSSDVKHSFWIPSAGGKIDTNTENTNEFWLEFDSKSVEEAGGLFYGKCAELCGPSHAYMDFKVKPLPRAEYDQWVKNMQAAAKEEKPKADSDLAQAGEELFNSNGCIACHAINPGEKRPTAPNLANFGDRSSIAGKLEHTEANLKKWISDPEKVKPGNKMSGTYKNDKLSAEDLDALAAYLMGLSVED